MLIADTVGDGSQAYFVEQMNKKAQEIGAQNTTFTTAYGRVEEGSTTTARDMAAIAQYAMEVPGFLEIAGTASYDGGPHQPARDALLEQPELPAGAGAPVLLPGGDGAQIQLLTPMLAVRWWPPAQRGGLLPGGADGGARL